MYENKKNPVGQGGLEYENDDDDAQNDEHYYEEEEDEDAGNNIAPSQQEKFNKFSEMVKEKEKQENLKSDKIKPVNNQHYDIEYEVNDSQGDEAVQKSNVIINFCIIF
jgi:hypothetical protein